MIILIYICDVDEAIYMINSIYNENQDIEYYFEKISKLANAQKINVNINVYYDENSIRIRNMIFNKSDYSFNSLVYYLEKEGFSGISINNVYLYKYDYYLTNNWINEYMTDFKKMIKIIIKSKYYSTIISELFKKKQKEIDFIQSNEYIEYLISKIIFIPISNQYIPFMDKFSLDIYLGGHDLDYINNYKGEICYKNIVVIILKIGCNIDYIIHEGAGHFLFSYFTIISNNYYYLISPNIKINNELIQNESGEQVELLLFGRVLESLKLKESLFLLNSKNHEIYNNFDDFRKNFMESNYKTYNELVNDFEGPFSELIRKVNWEKIEDNAAFPISMPLKNRSSEQPYIMLNKRRDDTLGKSLQNYHKEIIYI